jgi:hypothetical protein
MCFKLLVFKGFLPSPMVSPMLCYTARWMTRTSFDHFQPPRSRTLSLPHVPLKFTLKVKSRDKAATDEACYSANAVENRRKPVAPKGSNALCHVRGAFLAVLCKPQEMKCASRASLLSFSAGFLRSSLSSSGRDSQNRLDHGSDQSLEERTGVLAASVFRWSSCWLSTSYQ